MTSKGLKTIIFKYMKKLIEKIKAKISRKPLLVIPDVSGSAYVEVQLDELRTKLYKAWNAGARNTKFKEHPSSQTFDEWFSQHYC